MIATWREVPLADLAAGPGWHYDDPAGLEKLAVSLRRHGQLRALVVRAAQDGHGREVVDGRRLLQAMRTLGWTSAWVADVGTLDAEAASRMALDLELRFEVDYAKLAGVVAGLLAGGVPAASLAAAAPFTAERVSYLAQLATFDWSQFAEGPGDAQHGFAWGDEPAAQAALPGAEPPAALPAVVPAAATPLKAPTGFPDHIDAAGAGHYIADAAAEVAAEVHPSSRYGAPAPAPWTQDFPAEPVVADELPAPAQAEADEPGAAVAQMGLF